MAFHLAGRTLCYVNVERGEVYFNLTRDVCASWCNEEGFQELGFSPASKDIPDGYCKFVS